MPLRFLRRNLFACLQEVIRSFRLFGVAKSGLQIMKCFSHRHKIFERSFVVRKSSFEGVFIKANIRLVGLVVFGSYSG